MKKTDDEKFGRVSDSLNSLAGTKVKSGTEVIGEAIQRFTKTPEQKKSTQDFIFKHWKLIERS